MMKGLLKSTFMPLYRIFIALFLLPAALFGTYSSLSGKWSPEQYVPSLPVQEHYDLGMQCLQKKAWESAHTQFMVVVYHFPTSPFFSEALFHSGICCYFLGDFDLANRQFDKYLLQSGKLVHLEKVFEFKYHIAEFFREGKKKHLFGSRSFPKWASGKNDALNIYDEILAALPGKEIAARALFGKALLLRARKHFTESIEALQILIRQYPKHALSSESYLMISEVYLDSCKLESQNPDLVSLAQLNLQRFQKSFPSDERISLVEKNLKEMQEVCAHSLYLTGQFYDRKKKAHASRIYYQDILRRYPESATAQECKELLGLK